MILAFLIHHAIGIGDATRGLGEFYHHLQRLTQRKILDPIRLQEFWNMNTGKYNGLIDPGVYRFSREDYR